MQAKINFSVQSCGTFIITYNREYAMMSLSSALTPHGVPYIQWPVGVEMQPDIDFPDR